MMNKKADIGTLALIIIVLASGAILGGFVYKWSMQQRGESKIEACRLSILRAAQEKKLGFPGVKEAGTAFSKLECPRGELGDIYITKSDVVENDVINQDKAHRILAEGMRECWRMAGEGRYDPFSYWSDEKTYTGKSICLICKTIFFDDDLIEWMAKKQQRIVKENLGIDLKDYGDTQEELRRLEQEATKASERLLSSEEKKKKFEEEYLKYVITSPIQFMQKRNMPKTKITYWEHLYNEEAVELSAEDIEKMEKTQLLPNSIILVRMYRTKVRDPWWWVALKWALGALAVVGAVLIAIYLLPALALGAIGTMITAVASFAAKSVVAFFAIVLKSYLIALIVVGSLGVVAVYEAGVHTYQYCPDCNGIGGVVLIQPDVMPLDTETKVCLEGKGKCEDEDDFTDVKICNLLIN